MANVQVGYGKSDVIAPKGPFDLYVGATQVLTGSAYTMQNSRLILIPAAAVTGVAITLPLNPPDGAEAEISNLSAVTGSSVTGTVSANTGDVIVNGTLAPATAITVTASPTAGGATNTIKYVYSLNGSTVNGVNARTWFRVQ